jgi:hypothetical protein
LWKGAAGKAFDEKYGKGEDSRIAVMISPIYRQRPQLICYNDEPTARL